MKKKAVRKKGKKTSQSYNQYLIIGFVVAVILFLAAVSYQALKNANVLGTSVFLAKDGVESSLSEEAGKPQETPSIESSKSNEVHTPEPKEIHTPEPRELHTPEAKAVKPQLKALTNSASQRVELQEEGSKVELNAAAEGSEVQLKTEDDGSLKIHVKKPDGTEVEVEKHSLDKVNEVLEEEEIEIGTNSAKGFSITNKDTKADTMFPVNVDLANRKLSVDTPLGIKDLNVLPNQAVQSVLGQKVLDKIETTTSTSGAQLQVVELKLFANNPVFQVQGVDDKKLFGIIPVAVNKTALVSADTGQVVKTNTDLVNSILNLLSVQ